MTPARYASCKRLLRGIEILDARQKEVLLKLTSQRDVLKNELSQLAALIGERNYADVRLLVPMSRRIGTTSTALRQVQQDLVAAYREEHKLSRAKEMLLDRIQEHKIVQEEEELGLLVEEMISTKLTIQPSTRNED